MSKMEEVFRVRVREEEQEDNAGWARGQPEAGQESCRLIGGQVKLFPTRKGSIRSIFIIDLTGL